MKTLIVALVMGIVCFELIEHVVFPLFWFIKGRKNSLPALFESFKKVQSV